MTIDVDGRETDWAIMPANELEEVAQNVRMIIATARHSVPMDRAFGVDAKLIDEPINRAQAKLTAEIATAIREQEPRARLQKVFYFGDATDGVLGIRARIEIVEKNLRGGLN